MGKYDAEIGKAKKIISGWIKKSEGYKGVLLSLKKDHLALEKGELKAIQKKALDGNADKADVAQLDDIKEKLQMFLKKGEQEMADFDKWALQEPRKSMGFIAEALKLGKPETEAYKEVSAANKTSLNDVAGAISSVQRTWRADVEVALQNHLDKVEALEKIFDNSAGKQKAFLDQIAKGVERFQAECKTTYDSLKTDQFLKMISDINSGKIKDLPPVQIEQKCQQADQRTKLIPQLVTQIDKNYGRVIKSVPDNFIGGFTAGGLKKKLDDVYAKSKKDMATALKICSTTVEKAKAANLYK